MKTLGDPAQDAFQSQFQRKQLDGLQFSVESQYLGAEKTAGTLNRTSHAH